ncbi:MAG TPA: DUF3105 domain-containing protein [Candidatus Deferrimicrobiaceae bacterium]|nr:DUF3105 domain-containing protein [Candidatus Deferrimicrobiaceae bacterium]
MTTSRTRQASAGSGRRPRRFQPPPEPFIRRYRTRLLWLGAAGVFAVLAFMAYLNLTSPAYGCTIVWEPTPAPAASGPAGSAAPGGTAPPPVVGYVQPDMGHDHVGAGSFAKYLYCPPASGRHYFGTGIGPIRAEVYGPEERVIPQNWIHNLEHGSLVLLYRCPGEACEPTGQATLQQLYADWPNSPICGFARGEPNGLGSPVIARFDDMAWPYAVLVWGIVLPLESFDRAAILDFYEAYAERFNPEPFCPAPTPTPGPTGSPEATASPAASPSEGPVASPAESVPAESPGPSPS